jgi:hypothetical protein
LQYATSTGAIASETEDGKVSVPSACSRSVVFNQIVSNLRGKLPGAPGVAVLFFALEPEALRP